MPRKRKKYNQRSSYDKSLNRTQKGFFMKWKTDDPLGDHDKPTKASVGHLNPVMALKLTRNDFWDSFRQALHHRRMKWRMEIRMEFTTKTDEREFKRREIVGVGRLPELDEKYQETVEVMLTDAVDKNYIDRYVTTHVLQEVLAGDCIKDSDFTVDDPTKV